MEERDEKETKDGGTEGRLTVPCNEERGSSGGQKKDFGAKTPKRTVGGTLGPRSRPMHCLEFHIPHMGIESSSYKTGSSLSWEAARFTEIVILRLNRRHPFRR